MWWFSEERLKGEADEQCITFHLRWGQTLGFTVTPAAIVTDDSPGPLNLQRFLTLETHLFCMPKVVPDSPPPGWHSWVAAMGWMHIDNVLALFDVNGFYNTQSKRDCINLWDKRFVPLSKRWRAQQVTHAYQASRSPTLSSFTPRARHRIAEKRKKNEACPFKKERWTDIPLQSVGLPLHSPFAWQNLLRLPTIEYRFFLQIKSALPPNVVLVSLIFIPWAGSGRLPQSTTTKMIKIKGIKR